MRHPPIKLEIIAYSHSTAGQATWYITTLSSIISRLHSDNRCLNEHSLGYSTSPPLFSSHRQPLRLTFNYMLSISSGYTQQWFPHLAGSSTSSTRQATIACTTAQTSTQSTKTTEACWSYGIGSSERLPKRQMKWFTAWLLAIYSRLISLQCSSSIFSEWWIWSRHFLVIEGCFFFALNTKNRINKRIMVRMPPNTYIRLFMVQFFLYLYLFLFLWNLYIYFID